MKRNPAALKSSAIFAEDTASFGEEHYKKTANQGASVQHHRTLRYERIYATPSKK
jgi:hypothetical protein